VRASKLRAVRCCRRRETIEIYHIAPGKQVEFLKLIALYDEAKPSRD
jgi:hypothetical protein